MKVYSRDRGLVDRIEVVDRVRVLEELLEEAVIEVAEGCLILICPEVRS